MGSLKQGQIVHVDDGKCPKGQIRQVVGGDHVDAGGEADQAYVECVRP